MTVMIRAWFRRGGRFTKRLLEKLSLRLPLLEHAPKKAMPQAAGVYLTDALVKRDGLVIRILSSERVRLDERYVDLARPVEKEHTETDSTGSASEESLKPARIDETYREWIAPLLNLPHDRTVEELKLEVEKLLAGHPNVALHFPLKTYLRALSRNADDLTALAHRCSVSNQPSLQLLQALAGQKTKAEDISNPPEILIYIATEAYLNRA